MRLGIYLLLLSTFAVQANGFSQKAKVTLEMEQSSVLDIIRELRKVFDYQFLYRVDELKKCEKRDFKVRDAGVEEVMNKLLEGTHLTWRLEDRVILIKAAAHQSVTPPEGVTVKGRVTDKDGIPLPGVTILIKGTSVGVVTDTSGSYKMDLNKTKDVILVYSFIGMEKQEIVYKGQQEINVVLKEAVNEVEEVVVTGIFNKARESYTGAATTISAKELRQAGNRSILTSIRNIDPSFNIEDDLDIGSDPNKFPNITIRGNSSLPTDGDVQALRNDNLNNPNAPLFIMDGFEISLTQMVDMDESMVESITLLKDASATAMYGTRGANGVVVITTKKPEAGERIRVYYSGNLNIESPNLSSYNLLNAREKLAFEKAAGLYEGNLSQQQQFRELYNQRLLDVERGVDTYWLKYPVRVGVGQRHSLRVEGGSRAFRISGNVSLNNVVGTMKGSVRRTVSGGMTLAYRTERFSLSNNLMATFNRATNSPYGTFNDFAKLNSYWTPYDENGELLKKLEDRYYNGKRNNPGNPLYNAVLNSFDKTRYNQIQNNFSVEWKMGGGLSLSGRVGITSESNRSDKFTSPKNTKYDDYTAENLHKKGEYALGMGESFRYDVQVSLNYNKVFREKHVLYMAVNYNLAENNSEKYTIKVLGFQNEDADFLGMGMGYPENSRPSSSESMVRRMGVLGNVNYTYDRRYFVDFSGKYEGSSQFGSNNRMAPFWSIGAGWNLQNEHFMMENRVVTLARLRASYGLAGNQSFSSYQAMKTFKYQENSYQGWSGASLIAMGNPDLGWQVTKQLNVGLELEMFKGRVRLNTDFYHKLTDDLLADIDIPITSGFESYKANVGKVLNKGVEMTFNVWPVRNYERGITWMISGSLMHNKNEIQKISNSMKKQNEKKLANDTRNPSFLYEEGQSMNTIFAVRSLGIDPSNGKEMFLSLDGTKTYTWKAADKVPCGIQEPKVWGNLTTRVTYKDFTLNAVFGYRAGGQMYNSTLINKVENIQPFDNADKRVFYDRWREPGDHAFFKSVKENTSTMASSRFVMDENTLECRNISLEYVCRADFLKTIYCENVSLNLTMEDVFRFSTIKQERGLSYPFARKFAVSLSARF